MAKVRQQVEVQIKYEGYLRQQTSEINRFARMERRQIPSSFNFDDVKGLLTETRQKMKVIRPTSVGQASRIPGVTPSDISLLLVYLERQKADLRRNGEEAQQRLERLTKANKSLTEEVKALQQGSRKAGVRPSGGLDGNIRRPAARMPWYCFASAPMKSRCRRPQGSPDESRC